MSTHPAVLCSTLVALAGFAVGGSGCGNIDPLTPEVVDLHHDGPVPDPVDVHVAFAGFNFYALEEGGDDVTGGGTYSDRGATGDLRITPPMYGHLQFVVELSEKPTSSSSIRYDFTLSHPVDDAWTVKLIGAPAVVSEGKSVSQYVVAVRPSDVTGGKMLASFYLVARPGSSAPPLDLELTIRKQGSELYRRKIITARRQ
jgi:hypothetical protein